MPIPFVLCNVQQKLIGALIPTIYPFNTQQQREDDLDEILALVTEAEEDAPAAGAAGSRCEKALSNGTFRPQRGETTCNEGLCCGAARIPQGNVMMTIETCQAE